MDQHTDTENGRGSVAPALVAHADTDTATANDRGSGSSYPQGCTDNGLLMRGLQRLTAAGKPQAFGIYVALVVRAMGKGHCWCKDRRLMDDTGAKERTVQRYRAALVQAQLVTTQDRGAGGVFYSLTDSSDLNPATYGGMAEYPQLRRPNPATSGGIIPPHMAGSMKKRKEEEEGGTESVPSPTRNPEVEAACSEILASLGQVTAQEVGDDARERVARALNEGHAPEDLLRVIAWAAAVWTKDPKFAKHITAPTLFGKKVGEYIGKATAWAKESGYQSDAEQRADEQAKEARRVERLAGVRAGPARSDATTPEVAATLAKMRGETTTTTPKEPAAEDGAGDTPAEDDAQPPADDPARGFDIPESLRERMIPANPADLAGVRFQVPPFLTFDGDDQRVLLLIGVQLHAIAGRPGGPDLPTCRRHTVEMYESMGRRWHESGGVLVPVGVTFEPTA